MFSVIRLEGYLNFFVGMFLQVSYIPITTVVKTEDYEEGFLRTFFNFAFHSVSCIQFLFKSREGDKTWLKKFAEVSNYGKFICNIFGWDIVKILRYCKNFKLT